MNCSICGKRIVLVPSAAAARARKYGGQPRDYTRLFTTHDQCAIDKREADTLELMRRINQESEA